MIQRLLLGIQHRSFQTVFRKMNICVRTQQPFATGLFGCHFKGIDLSKPPFWQMIDVHSSNEIFGCQPIDNCSSFVVRSIVHHNDFQVRIFCLSNVRRARSIVVASLQAGMRTLKRGKPPRGSERAATSSNLGTNCLSNSAKNGEMHHGTIATNASSFINNTKPPDQYQNCILFQV